MSYRTYYDDNGDETVELEEAPFDLPRGYADREVDLAWANTARGTQRADLLVSRVTLHRTVQTMRKHTPWFGDKFRKDPRRFSSLPRPRDVGR